MPTLLEMPVTDQITAFLDRIGIPWSEAELSDNEFLPGIRLEAGVLKFDRSRLTWPGDLLHEAGHIAVTPPSERADLDGNLEVSPANEMAALAWSYAAAIGCGIEPSAVFHEGGYKGGGRELIEQFSTGDGIGVPMLRWYRMTRNFPHMDSWLREIEDPTSILPNQR
jgi:hypothetical protein